MSAQEAANLLLNQNYRPNAILKALEEMKKPLAATSDLKVSR